MRTGVRHDEVKDEVRSVRPGSVAFSSDEGPCEVDFIMDYMKEARNEPTYGVHHNKIHLILRLISLTASRHVRG